MVRLRERGAEAVCAQRARGVRGAEAVRAWARGARGAEAVRARRARGAEAVRARAAAAALAFAIVFALAVFAFPCAAWGEEGPSADNQLNVQQLPDSSFIYDASISDLDEADSYLDGQTVQITGEVVGDRINAELDSSHCWITLEAIDGSHSEMGVFVSKTSTSLIDTYGAYGKRGTVLQVRGTFNLACSEHEGVTDLHVDHVSVVSKGSETPDAFNPMDFVPGIVLTLAGGVLIVVFFRLRESRR
ncbi:MAG: hydrolase [Eggerthellaceae bacterium]|nr:hydrolase [Eggerthellaceae bacterium]